MKICLTIIAQLGICVMNLYKLKNVLSGFCLIALKNLM